MVLVLERRVSGVFQYRYEHAGQPVGAWLLRTKTQAPSKGGRRKDLWLRYDRTFSCLAAR